MWFHNSFQLLRHIILLVVIPDSCSRVGPLLERFQPCSLHFTYANWRGLIGSPMICNLNDFWTSSWALALALHQHCKCCSQSSRTAPQTLKCCLHSWCMISLHVLKLDLPAWRHSACMGKQSKLHNLSLAVRCVACNDQLACQCRLPPCKISSCNDYLWVASIAWNRLTAVKNVCLTCTAFCQRQNA